MAPVGLASAKMVPIALVSRDLHMMVLRQSGVCLTSESLVLWRSSMVLGLTVRVLTSIGPCVGSRSFLSDFSMCKVADAPFRGLSSARRHNVDGKPIGDRTLSACLTVLCQ